MQEKTKRPVRFYVSVERCQGIAEPERAMPGICNFRLCTDLGLVVKEDETPCIANPMYHEVLARQMTYSTQDAIPKPEWEWEKPDGTLDMEKLLQEFQKFWRKHGEVWEQKSSYTEAFPHLLAMAFLQRVLNGGGRIEREYAAGRGRMDLASGRGKKNTLGSAAWLGNQG
jgi:hypothetical protein